MKDINLIAQEVDAFAAINPNDYTKIFEKIKTYRYSDYSDDYYQFKAYVLTIENHYFQQALEEWQKTGNEALKNSIIQQADIDYDRRYDILVRMDDDEAFSMVLQYAEDYLKGGDFIFHQGKYVSGEALLALAEAYYQPRFKDRVHSFLSNSFEYAQNYIRQAKDGEPEGDTLLTICQAISKLRPQDRKYFASYVFELYTYAATEGRAYDVYQASGYIALLLTLFDHAFEPTTLDNAVRTTGKHYRENVFVHQTLYALWVLSENAPAAFAYFTDEANRDWLQFAVMALADLGYTEAIPYLRKNQAEEQDPVLWEVYEEAIYRLSNNYVTPSKEDRMVWLGESVSPTQRALGAESKNVFVERANKKVGLDNTVYETDDE